MGETEILPQSETKPEFEFDHHSVAVVMTGHYPGWTENGTDTSSTRGNVALETLQTAINRGYQVVINMTEATPAEFNAKIPSGVTVLVETSEQVKRTIRSIQVASQLEQVRALVYLQPEKDQIIPLIPQIVQPIYDETGQPKADLVLPRRNEELWQTTFPDYMRRLEQDNNKVANRLLRTCGLLKPQQEDLDLFFGVSAFRNTPDIIKIVQKTYQFTQGITKGPRKHASALPETGIGISIIPYLEMLIQGYQLANVEIPFRYPAAQKADEEKPETFDSFRAKRQRQRYLNLTEEIHFLKRYLEEKGYPQKRPSLLKPL